MEVSGALAHPTITYHHHCTSSAPLVPIYGYPRLRNGQRVKSRDTRDVNVNCPRPTSTMSRFYPISTLYQVPYTTFFDLVSRTCFIKELQDVPNGLSIPYHMPCSYQHSYGRMLYPLLTHYYLSVPVGIVRAGDPAEAHTPTTSGAYTACCQWTTCPHGVGGTLCATSTTGMR